MEGRDLKGKAAISGLGISEMGRVYGHDARHFAGDAIQRSIEDAGLRKDQIDGLLVNAGVTPLGGMGGVGLQNELGLTHLRLLSSMNVGGATAHLRVGVSKGPHEPAHRRGVFQLAEGPAVLQQRAGARFPPWPELLLWLLVPPALAACW